VLDNDDFIAWSNENIVAVVGHNGATGGKEDHKPVTEKDAKTKEEREVCPVYPGLTCKEHQDLRAAFSNPPDGWGKIGQSDGVPNHWMVGPDGLCEKVENKDAALPKSLIEVLTAFQKKYEGKPVPLKKWDAYNKSFTDAEKALADGKWKAALAAYGKVDADGKKLSKGLVEKVAAKVAELNEKVVAKFTEVKDGADDTATKLKALKALRSEVGQKLSTGFLPVVADLDAWIKEAAAAKPAPEPAGAK
jgi:hypothetical protein